jgi:hypothetical protein
VNISAITSPEAQFPPYISINEEKDGQISVTVRSEAKDGTCGSTSMVVLSCEEFRQLSRDCTTYIARRVRRENEQPPGVA